MKRKNTFLLIVTTLLLSVFLLSACEEYTDCTGIITVMKADGEDINKGIPVQGCKVVVGDSTDVTYVGVTDAMGQVKNVWKFEANLKIDAVKDEFSGIGVINLKEGEVVEQTVWLKPTYE
ncbi:MAG: hypothetical protein WC142_01920 [Bacteroidales bacterium]|jgi:hypothetical protein|nr:hypothetical protein [Bacteroidales bacterium]MDD2686989.1 hypothetical protein [Bacteroidales bacterium]MDD3330346.1 hypothetical protein [Bacteroidales bacterium]MDD3690752.1 hypothetical protein [Bacteroidales bacterium]MDD4044287.1 hypothetical protein [Bacteroidales bacterium]